MGAAPREVFAILTGTCNGTWIAATWSYVRDPHPIDKPSSTLCSLEWIAGRTHGACEGCLPHVVLFLKGVLLLLLAPDRTNGSGSGCLRSALRGRPPRECWRWC